ncbi:MAG TPA: non-canonical purine NTP pyrophosphatase [Gaiellaceae bacterium]|nr:non-canonical purine NTP pyrophosphatase [Gaiellaceae bacterium]HEU5405214.1 non-canonical purine NTP pyrophosphatase [Gaiellaceae bacterium]
MDGLRAVLCSRNRHKARELEALLPGWTIEPLDRDDYPPETGATYYDNAALKARFGREHTDGWVLAEDSGLEVDSLGGRPGVLSARYAPEGAPAVAKLLGELEGIEERRARYVSELVLLSADGRELRGTGTLEGRIAHQARGEEGFGYDPIFIPDGEEQTVAELGNEWKAERSHRARAARALLSVLGDARATTS